MILEIHNGYANDGKRPASAEEELHRAEKSLPGADGLLLRTQAMVYLAQGRLDHAAKFTFVQPDR